MRIPSPGPPSLWRGALGTISDFPSTYSKSGTELILLGGERFSDPPGRSVLAFHRLKHLLWLLFERASRCYESRQPTLDVLFKCFEQRDALGSSDEYSEVVWS